MKNLIDITDEDVIKAIDKVHILTRNTVISRNGIHGLGFMESHRKYGSCYIEILMESIDYATDGYFSTESKCRLQFYHNSVWFAELGADGEPSNYNRNHFFGYLKLIEMGYKLPDKPML